MNGLSSIFVIGVNIALNSGAFMPFERKSQVRPVLSLILFVLVLSSLVFAAENDETNTSSNSTIKQITQIIDFVFNAFGLSARLITGNSTPAAGQELGFYENKTFITSSYTKDDGYASINYSPAYGTYNFSVIFNGTEFLSPAKSFLVVDVRNKSINSRSEEKLIFSNYNLNATRTYQNDSVMFSIDIHSMTSIDWAILTVAYPGGEEVNRTLLQNGNTYNYIWQDTGMLGNYTVSDVYAKAGNVSNQTQYDNLTFEIISNYSSGNVTNNLTDPCMNVSCPDVCDATTLLKEGYCINGICAYAKILNSTDCGFVEPDIDLPPNNMTMYNETLNYSSGNMTNVTIEEMPAIQGTAEIGSPVIWNKKIIVRNNGYDNELLTVNVSVDNQASNVSVADGNVKKDVSQKSRKNSIASATKKEFEFADRIKPREEKEYEVAYETPAPEKMEEAPKTSNDRWTKKVTVYSDYSYTNVLSYTDITDAEPENIHLFWNIDNSLTDVTANSTINTTYADTDNNGKIDRIYWTVPHLSEQEFVVIVDLTVINVQSYPTVGGNWTVRYTTQGTANLTISVIDGTTFGSIAPKDLEFLDVMCGSISLKKQLIFTNADGNSYTYYDLYATREEIVTQIAELNNTITQINGG